MIRIPDALRRRVRAPAGREEIEGFLLSSWPLPDQARSFYAITNGLSIPQLGTEVLSLAAARQYGEAIGHLPHPSFFGLLPITESNDSNPYCLVLGERLRGAVLLLSHDGPVQVTHSSMQSFLDALAKSLESGGRPIHHPAAEVIDDPLVVAQADLLVEEVLGRRAADVGVLLPLVPACSPQALLTLLEVDDMCSLHNTGNHGPEDEVWDRRAACSSSSGSRRQRR